MNGYDSLIESLKYLGVEFIFGLPGDIQTDLYRAVKGSKIEWITVRNEKCAAFMADIYSRISGKVGVCFSTLGPGATNLVSGLANSTQDRSSVIALSDQVSLKQLKLNTHQYLDYNNLFSKNSGVVKGSYLVRETKEIPLILKEAFKLSTQDYPGAVHIGLPVDVMMMKAERTEIIEESEKNISSDSKKIANQIYEKIKGKKCLVFAGPSINRSMAQKEFINFIEKTGIPVLTSFNGKNSISNNHKLYIGTISRHLQQVFSEIFNDSELILLIGYDYIEGVKPQIFGDMDKIINLDCVDNRVVEDFYPNNSFFVNLKEVLDNLAELDYEKKEHFDVTKIKIKIKKVIYKDLDMNVYPPRPHRVIEAINKTYGDNSIIVCDVGLNKYYSGLLLEKRESNKILFSNGLSSMAFSSGALAAKLADPSKDVLVICGDGGLLMDLQEISTCIRYNIPLTIVVFNNGGLGLIEQAQKKEFGNYHEVHFESPDYCKLIESFGGKGHRVRSHAQLEEILDKSRMSKGVNLIEVPINYAEGI